MHQIYIKPHSRTPSKNTFKTKDKLNINVKNTIYHEQRIPKMHDYCVRPRSNRTRSTKRKEWLLLLSKIQTICIYFTSLLLSVKQTLATMHLFLDISLKTIPIPLRGNNIRHLSHWKIKVQSRRNYGQWQKMTKIGFIAVLKIQPISFVCDGTLDRRNSDFRCI